jgi:dihydrofolate reductase
MISIIVARSSNGVIGNKEDLPWKLSDDLKHFAKITKGHTVVMGRKTYESIVSRLGHALPDRKNIVITSATGFNAPGCTVINSVDEAIKMFSSSLEEVFVIGGGKIYDQFLSVSDKLYITQVDIICDGDTFFPDISDEDWKLISSEQHSKDEKHLHSFAFLQYIRV